MHKIHKAFVSFILLIIIAVAASAQHQEKLWYNAPAEKWTDALPIGNGRLGAMVFGNVAKDHLQFNEETLWTGKPRAYNKDGGANYLNEIRKLLFEGKQKEAEDLATKHFMGLKSEEGDKEAWIKDMRSLKGLTGNPALANFDDSEWKSFLVPTYEGWESAGMEGLDGALWFRTSFTLPDNWEGKNVVLDLNRVRNLDYTYVNGALVGTTNGEEGRKYIIPANVLKRGKNIIAVQVLNFSDKGGIGGYKDTSRPIGVYLEGSDITKGISLNGMWKFKIQNDSPPAVAQFQASYQPFGDLWLNFKKHKNFTSYKRELDLKTAIAKTTYLANGITYTREYFASAPNQAIIVRLSASKPRSISLEAGLSSPHKSSSVSVLDANTLALKVAVKDGALKGTSYLRVNNKGGSVKLKSSKIIIDKADEVYFYLTAATNFVNAKDISGNPSMVALKALKGIGNNSYNQLKAAHTKEYQQYYNRFSIDLGRSANEDLPTNERLEKFPTAKDPAFAALYVQYGRYLLISSSRLGTQPANLQGIWNDLLAPPWGSKYTTNINAEMNYWPAEPLNLSALHQPFITMATQLAEQGKETAQKYYGAKGWVLHHNTDLWRGTAPINASNHGIWQGGSGWVSSHLWEHYLYTQDVAYLKETAYPIMKSAAIFYNDVLIKDPKTGWLISSPSNSPENGGLVAGPTMDHQIIRNLFKSCIQASKILNIDQELSDTLAKKLAIIAPNQIGKHGQLQEWLEDKDDPENKHRHVSHLWGVHPGYEINWDETPELMKAAKQSLIYRGDEGTGWSLAWKINFWSRFKDGDHALKLVKMLLRPATNAGGSYLNLFDAHPPFQIDGNFGGAAGIGEMLMQSHLGYIEVLPALPQDFNEGTVKGICARGGFELDFTWKEGKLSALTILSKAGEECVLKCGSKTIKFNTEKGNKYTFNGKLERL